MSNTTLISFNFNEYDIIRTHFMSNTINYVYITDGDKAPNGWNLYKIDIHKHEPWFQSLYVRYHPFEFTDNDYVIVIDGSLSVTSGIDELVTKFIEGDYDIGLLLSHQPDIIGRIYRWREQFRITPEESRLLLDNIKDTVGYKYKGTIAGSVRLLKRTDKTIEYLDKCWKSICTKDRIIRLDEVPSTIELENVGGIKIMPLSTQVIQGGAFIYNGHKANGLYRLNYNKSHSWLKNKPIEPIRIGPEYNRKYSYKSEAMCLTRYFDDKDLRHWIDWHLNIGFDHIHIFDNESDYDCKGICEEYGDKVSYELITGNARHYKIFNDYVNSVRCKSEWIIPIDDDEYLELNTGLVASVNGLIDLYRNKYPSERMFAVRWKHLFPKVFHSERTGPITEYCTEENPRLATYFQQIGDRGIKTFVNRYGNIYYEETEENPSGGHVPKHSASNGAMLYNGELIRTCSCKRIPADAEPARLLHFRYKGYSWYRAKEQDIESRGVTLDNTSGKLYTRNYRFSGILDRLP